MREVGAGEPAAGRAGLAGGLDPAEVLGAALGAALDDPLGDGGEGGMEGHWSGSCQVRPSRSRSIAAAIGPVVPAG